MNTPDKPPDQSDRPLCGAKNRQGQPCRRRPVPGGVRCKMHGGASLRGLASPSLKHGRFSRSLPADVAARYEASAADPELLALSAEVAVLDARVHELMGCLATGECSQQWARLREAWNEFQAAMQAKDTASVNLALQGVGQLITSGAAQADVWSELNAAIARKATLTGLELKRRRELETYISIEEALLLTSALGSAVRERIADQAVLDAIGREFERILGSSPAVGRLLLGARQASTAPQAVVVDSKDEISLPPHQPPPPPPPEPVPAAMPEAVERAAAAIVAAPAPIAAQAAANVPSGRDARLRKLFPPFC